MLPIAFGPEWITKRPGADVLDFCQSEKMYSPTATIAIASSNVRRLYREETFDSVGVLMPAL